MQIANRARVQLASLIPSCIVAMTLLGAGSAGAQQAFAIAHAHSQSSPLETRITVDAKHTDLLTVIDLIMKQANANYTLDSHLEDAKIGAVRLRNVPLMAALSAVIRASHSPATFRLENDIFAIVPEEEAPKSAGYTEANGDRITVELDQASLYEALKRIFASVHMDFSLEPGLGDSQVTVHMHNQPLHVVLETLLRSVPTPLTYRVENGIYTIVKQPASAATP